LLEVNPAPIKEKIREEKSSSKPLGEIKIIDGI
jgi:hypothetical protein